MFFLRIEFVKAAHCSARRGRQAQVAHRKAPESPDSTGPPAGHTGHRLHREIVRGLDRLFTSHVAIFYVRRAEIRGPNAAPDDRGRPSPTLPSTASGTAAFFSGGPDCPSLRWSGRRPPQPPCSPVAGRRTRAGKASIAGRAFGEICRPARRTGKARTNAAMPPVDRVKMSTTPPAAASRTIVAAPQGGQMDFTFLAILAETGQELHGRGDLPNRQPDCRQHAHQHRGCGTRWPWR